MAEELNGYQGAIITDELGRKSVEKMKSEKISDAFSDEICNMKKILKAIRTDPAEIEKYEKHLPFIQEYRNLLLGKHRIEKNKMDIIIQATPGKLTPYFKPEKEPE